MDRLKKKILIVDDEEDLCEILHYNLSNEGFHTEIAHSAEEALTHPLEEYDLLILDVMMGAMSGFRLTEKLRNELQIEVPVIFLTARDTENDLLSGFRLGADDYLTKPFSINELIARVRAVLKRTELKERQDRSLRFGNIELDNVRKRVLIDNERVDLTKKEYEILFLLLENQGRVYSREDILRRIWGDDVIVTDRTVDVNITRIRNKLGKYAACLKNRTGYGYFFEF
jgi:two-component system, OmpR family, alkaline phosphatase synthesis response regulator PhoP